MPWLQRQVPATHREHLFDIFATQGVTRVTFMRVSLVSASLRLGVSLRITLFVIPGKIMMQGLSVLVLRGPPSTVAGAFPVKTLGSAFTIRTEKLKTTH